MNLKCSKCNTEKDSSLFHKNKRMKSGFHNHCKECRKGEDNGKKLQAYYDNKERYNSKAKKWKENNREKWNAYMVEYRKQDSFTYKTPLNRHLRAKSRANKLKQTPPWSDMGKIRKIYDLCKELNDVNTCNFQVDHIHPIQGENSKGLHVWYNLMIIPARLNQSKGNKIIENKTIPRVSDNFECYLSKLKIYAELARNKEV